ncbi:MAG: glutamyl-tRNA reductase [Pseudomonadota bacterium]
MHLLTVGLNHQTAPVAIRERAAFAPERLLAALQDIRRQGTADEVAILSTCNRTELYCGLDPANDRRVVEWFCDYHHIARGEIEPHLYRHPDQEAVKHAFRVAAGLDSMMLGETQILGQMKDAFGTAHKAGATGKLLNRLFQQTFAVAKQVRTDTSIGASAVSVASAAVTLARQIFTRLDEQTVLLIGAGDMIELCARHLREHRVKHMIVANRTVERAQVIAREFGAEAISLGELPARLADADIVISSTASPLPILGKGTVERALKARRRRTMFMVDIAVPRDIEPEVGDLDDVYLYTIDDLKDVVQENRQSRVEAAAEAERIIDTKVVDFMRWLKSLDAVPTIRHLRDSAEAMCELELERARARLKRGEDPQEVLEHLAHALTNKFTHAPSDALLKADHEADRVLLEAARRLFNLDER